jgi:hypothetical protein
MGNTAPIFSRRGNIQGITGFGAAAIGSDYSGQHVNNAQVFVADAASGSFVQSLRVKFQGATNTQVSVMRIFVARNRANLVSTLGTPAAPTISGTSGGSLPLLSGPYFAKVIADDAWGAHSAVSNESTTFTLTGSDTALSVAFTPLTGAAGHDIFLGNVTNGQMMKFEAGITSPFVITSLNGEWDTVSGYLGNAQFIGELAIPVWTASNTSVLPELIYPLNVALPPGHRILVGLGTALTSNALLAVTAIAGDY